MDEGKSTKKTEAAEALVKTRSSKKAATKKATAAPKPTREKAENPVVFAFRLSEAERTKIHDAAGSAKASKFVLAAALAAASGDVDAFKTVVASRATKQ